MLYSSITHNAMRILHVRPSDRPEMLIKENTLFLRRFLQADLR
jgi:hypothetical protein